MREAASISKQGGRTLGDGSVQIAPVLADTSTFGYVRGNTLTRDVLVRRLNCSEVEAELVVDQLEVLGFVRFDSPPFICTTIQGHWSTDPR
jgi:hypothetical protein